ncbi:MAG: phosphoribosylglycinamide formyltransferase [Anaerolineae bacterium]|nr:phosphoribosylglycinamide formyltransferase [Anaerolineae bacterium]
MKRLVVMISGNGTNLQALIDASQSGKLDARIVAVFSNRADAFGLVRAEQAGIPAVTFPLTPYKQAGRPRNDYDGDLARLVAAFQPDLIVLAGWMLILSPLFLSRFPGQVINLHPALPGQFPGTHAIERAYAAFQRGEIDHTGVMVHWVIPQIDAGEVLASVPVAIEAGDTLQELETRTHATEHRLIVEATQMALQRLP